MWRHWRRARRAASCPGPPPRPPPRRQPRRPREKPPSPHTTDPGPPPRRPRAARAPAQAQRAQIGPTKPIGSATPPATSTEPHAGGPRRTTAPAPSTAPPRSAASSHRAAPPSLEPERRAARDEEAPPPPSLDAHGFAGAILRRRRCGEREERAAPLGFPPSRRTGATRGWGVFFELEFWTWKHSWMGIGSTERTTSGRGTNRPQIDQPTNQASTRGMLHSPGNLGSLDRCLRDRFGTRTSVRKGLQHPAAATTKAHHNF